MSTRADVLAAIAAKLVYVAGIKSVPGLGRPEAMPYGNAPFAYFEIMREKQKPLTMGTSGTVEETYTVQITIVLSGKATLYHAAQSDAVPFSDRLRAAFAADWTLGGTCFYCALTDGDNNLNRYRDRGGEIPQLRYMLSVTQYVTADAVAP